MTRAALFAAALLLAGCGGGGRSAVESVPAESLLEPVAPGAPSRFIPAGAPGRLLLTCGTHMVRVEEDGEGITLRPGPEHDYLAAWLDPDGTTDRYVVQSLRGPALIEGDRAWFLPGWMSGAVAGPAAFSGDGRELAVAPHGPGGPSVMVWSLPLGRPDILSDAKGGDVDRLCWSEDGRTILTSDDENRIAIYRIPDRAPAYVEGLDPGLDGRISAVALSPDGDWFVVAATAVRVQAWKLPIMNTRLKPWGRVDLAFFARDRTSVVTVDETHTAIRWLINYGDVRVDSTRVLGGPTEVAADAAGRYLFSLNPDGSISAFRSTDMAPVSVAGDSTLCR